MSEERRPDYSIAPTKEENLIKLWRSIGADPQRYSEDLEILDTDDFVPRYESYEAYQADVASRAGAWRPELGISAINTSEIDCFLQNLKYQFSGYRPGEKVQRITDPLDESSKVDLYELKKVLFSQQKQTCDDIMASSHKEMISELEDKSVGCFLVYNDARRAADTYGGSSANYDQGLLLRKLIAEIEVAEKRENKRQSDFNAYWKSKAAQFYKKYQYSANIRYTSKGERIEPITWKDILARTVKIKSSIGSSVVFDRYLPLYSISGGATHSKDFIMEETGDGYLSFVNYKVPTYSYDEKRKSKPSVHINKKDGSFSVDKASDKGFCDVSREVKEDQALQFFCAYVRFLYEHIGDLKKDISTPDPDCALGLYRQDPETMRKLDYRSDEKMMTLINKFREDATCLREMPDEALLFDTARIFLAIMLDQLADEQIARMRKRERSLRVTPIVFTFIFFAALVGVYAYFRYTLIDQKIGQYAMTALLGLILIFDIFVACVVRRNRQFKRAYGLKKGEEGIENGTLFYSKGGRGRRWALSFLIVSLMLLITGSYFMGRYDAYDDTYYYNRRAGHTMVVAGLFDTDATELVIPEHYQDYVVKGVAANSFLLPNSVTTVKASPLCEKIGSLAFVGCKNLQVLDLSDSPAALSAHAFDSCNSLQSVVLNAATVIPKSCFRNCTSLTEVRNGANVIVIEDNAFRGCTSLNAAKCFPSAQVVGDRAFSKTATDSVDLSGYLVVGDYAFAECDSLLELNCASLSPELVLGKGAFSSCDTLHSVELTFNGTAVPKDLFEDCPNLMNAHIYGSVSSIDKGIFYDCPVDTITLPYLGKTAEEYVDMGYFISKEGKKTLRYIKVLDSTSEVVVVKNGFKDCESLISLECNTITRVEKAGFKNCSSFENIAFTGITVIEEEAFANTALQTYTSGAEVTEIGDRAFAECRYLTSATIMDPSLKLGKEIFDDCPALIEFSCGAIGSNDKPRTLESVLGSSVANVEKVLVTEQNVLANAAFAKSDNLSSVVFYSEVPVIPKKCFSGCEQLSNVVIPGVKTVKKQAFEDCASITSICFDGVERIEANAYKGTSVSTLNNATIYDIGEGAFAKTPLTSVSLLHAELDLGKKVFDDCSYLTTVSLGRLAHKNKATSMAYAFGSGRKSVVSVTILHQGEFADEAFMGCEALNTISMAQPVSVIPKDAFRECYVLMELGIAGVQEVEKNAFYRCYAIDRIPFETEITVIGDGAFAESGLVSFQGGSGLVKIGKNAFRKTEDLSVLDLSACQSLDIKKNAFDACDKLTDVRLYALGPNGKERTMKYMFGSTRRIITFLQIVGTVSGKKSFADCSELISVTMSDLQTFIPEQCFKGCSKLTVITAPAVVTIKEQGFYGCASLTSVLPAAVTIEEEAYKGTSVSVVESAFITTIGEKAFAGTPINSVLLPNVELDIDKNAFDGCDYLSTLILGRLWHKKDPVSMEFAFGSARKNMPAITLYEQGELADCAFCGCSALETVTIYSPISTIPKKAFSECYFVSHVNISGVQNIEDYAFYRCYAIDRVPCETELSYIGKRAFSESGITSFRGGESLREIDNSAFRKAEDITTLDVSACWALDVEKNAFAECSKLTDVKLYALGPNGKEHTMKYMFADSRRIIMNLQIASPIHSEDAFADCESLVSMILSDLQVSIPEGAFSGCSSLLTVYGRNVEEIGDEAFEDCIHFYSYTFSNLTEIGDYAFSNTALTSFDGKDTVRRIGKSAFRNTSITSVSVIAPDAEIGKNAFAGCSLLSEVTINSIGTQKSPKPLSYLMGDSLETVTALRVTNQSSIAKSAFVGAENLSVLIYDMPATEIPKNAFKNCPSLESFEMASVTKIGASAFENCRSLRSVNLSSELTEIGKRAFKDCVSLQEITIPNGVAHIEKKTFSGCTGLCEVNFGSGLRTIEKRAFEYCSNLTYLTLNEGFEKIRKLAFLDCTSLNAVYLPASLNRLAGLSFFDYDQEFYVLYGGTEEMWDEVHKGMAFLGTEENIIFNSYPYENWQAEYVQKSTSPNNNGSSDDSQLLSAARAYGSNAVLPDYYEDVTNYAGYPSTVYSGIDAGYYNCYAIEFDGFFADRLYYLEHMASVLYEDGFTLVTVLGEEYIYGLEMIKGDTVIRLQETSSMSTGDGYHVWYIYSIYTINNAHLYN